MSGRRKIRFIPWGGVPFGGSVIGSISREATTVRYTTTSDVNIKRPSWWRRLLRGLR